MYKLAPDWRATTVFTDRVGVTSNTRRDGQGYCRDAFGSG
jgi:hypothetical protein